ncbi:major facilitator superfamily MFS_1 [Thermosinus carboxydivorans Nor1]|uniref:Major facilitator superfamily MFS_1 n=1 Tax=Thermosinus carboxydivorans Nor1 TaxID=401526 RepID=A1HPH5_9FIRM|nr:MFS transporter [Thermosinus carboxydivorans]EAX47951.1 major facilitator superfamily MFS_1 [Thermosinus carboxydivorans Nor1]
MESVMLTRKIPNKRWMRIIPAAVIVYIFSFMDRTNFGFAMAGGMNEELGITATMAGLAAGIFFVGYLFLQFPGGHIAEKGGAKKFIAVSIVAFGVFAMACGFAKDIWQMMVLRFLLGVAEGGVWPAILVMLSHWFPNEERARANALFTMCLPLATMITGPISGWIIAAWGWRWVFIIEGAITIALVAIWWPMVSDRPENAKWLSNEERDYLVARIKEEQLAFQSGEPVSYKKLIRDINLWKLVVVYFCYQVGIYGFAMWLPVILKSLTKMGITYIGLLTILPYIAAMIGIYVFGVLSDKHMNRKLYTAIPLAGFALCFYLSTQFDNQVWIAYTFLIGCGVFFEAACGVFWTFPPMLFPSEVAGGARGIINALGNMGGFFGPFIVGWCVTKFGSTNIGVYVLSASLLIGFITALTLPEITSTGIPNNASVSSRDTGV